MIKIYYLIGLLYLSVQCLSCIGDDYIDDYVMPEIRFNNILDTIEFGSTYQLEATYFNNVGKPEQLPIEWSSDAPTIISVDSEGLLEAVGTGSATITATVNTSDPVSKSTLIHVGETTTIVNTGTKRLGTIVTTSSYVLEGGFQLVDMDGQLVLEIAENYKATTALPGLYVYLSNNLNTVSGALEIGEVQIFEGQHRYNLTSGIGLTDYNFVLYWCKPFNVKVGEGIMGDPE